MKSLRLDEAKRLVTEHLGAVVDTEHHHAITVHVARENAPALIGALKKIGWKDVLLFPNGDHRIVDTKSTPRRLTTIVLLGLAIFLMFEAPIFSGGEAGPFVFVLGGFVAIFALL
jgi:hypothetical protein